MRRVGLNYDQVGYFSKIVLDYINQSPSLKTFYKYDVNIESFQNVIEDKSKENIDRQLLSEVLYEQNQHSLKEHDIVRENIQLLKKESTYTITTGHQLCILGGPLYFLYKIVSVINLCKKLKIKYPNNDFVPIFWLASEDHGEGEIKSINLFGKTLECEYTEKGASGRRSTKPIQVIVNELSTMLYEDSNSKNVLELFHNAYFNYNTIGEATSYYLSKLFGKDGLVIVDGDDKRLKEVYKPIIKDELINQSTFFHVGNSVERISKEYKIQVNPREINLFYLIDDGRYRIEYKDNKYLAVGTEITFSKEEVLQELEQFPERFSPNVIMRPLYQEKILPNLAYIGGPGELAYWLELKPIFEYHQLNYPMLILRDSVQFFDQSLLKKLKKLDIKEIDFFSSKENLVKAYISDLDENISLDGQKEKIITIFQEIENDAKRIDKGLGSSIVAEKVKQLKTIDQLQGKLNKALKRNNEVALSQIQKLKDRFFPNGGLQERYDSFIPFYIKYGDDFLDFLGQNLDPLNLEFTVLLEEET